MTAIAKIAEISMVLEAVLAILVVLMATAVVVASRQEEAEAACVALIRTMTVVVVVAIHHWCHRTSRCHMVERVAVAKNEGLAEGWGK